MPRFTIDIDEKFNKLLTDLSDAKGLNKAEIVRRAVASYSYLEKETNQEGKKVSITDEQDRVLKDIVLP